MSVHGICHLWEGCALGLAVAVSAFINAAYPIVSFGAALCAFLIGAHGVWRLIWRWWRGYPNFLSDREAARHDRS